MNEKQKPAEQSIEASTSRRKILIGSAAAGLAYWHKPALKSVVLPAHAQTSSDLDAQNNDFFVTVGSATTVTNGKQNNSPRDPVSDLSFEAQALSQGGGVFNIRIAAEVVASPGNGRIAPSSFEYGWTGTANSTSNASSLFTATGCAQDENLRIVSISQSSLVVEMGYFGSVIRLDLVDANASLPVFPLSCAI